METTKIVPNDIHNAIEIAKAAVGGDGKLALEYPELVSALITEATMAVASLRNSDWKAGSE